MDHSEAVKMIAAEKYLLGELSASERDSFEDHFFSCEECAADVRSATILLDNFRELTRTGLAPQNTKAAPALFERRTSWLAWLRPWSVPVLAALLIVVVYQNFVTIPSLRRGTSVAPQALATFSLVTAGARSGSEVTITIGKKTPFGLYVDIPARTEFSSYTCQVLNESGKSLFSVAVTPEQARDSVQLLIPGATLDSGRYHLVVRGNRTGASAPGEELARLPFAVQIK